MALLYSLHRWRQMGGLHPMDGWMDGLCLQVFFFFGACVESRYLCSSALRYKSTCRLRSQWRRTDTSDKLKESSTAICNACRNLDSDCFIDRDIRELSIYHVGTLL